MVLDAPIVRSNAYNRYYELKTPWGTALFSVLGGQLVQFTRNSGQPVFWNQAYPEENTLEAELQYLHFSGCPLSAPWFGQLSANPVSVQNSFIGEEIYPIHGWVRSLPWEFLGAYGDESKNPQEIRVSFSLQHTWGQPENALYWRIDYYLSANSLRILVHTRNDGQSVLTISQGLHNYFYIDQWHATTIQGLQGAQGWDADRDWQALATLPASCPLQAMDWVLTGVPQTIELSISAVPVMSMRLHGCSDVVLWNPGAEHALTHQYWQENQAWQQFICIEPAQLLAHAPTLVPGASTCFGYTLLFA